MRWQFSNDAPIYSQLIEQIKVGIVSGMFAPGERLPSHTITRITRGMRGMRSALG